MTPCTAVSPIPCFFASPESSSIGVLGGGGGGLNCTNTVKYKIQGGP